MSISSEVPSEIFFFVLGIRDISSIGTVFMNNTKIKYFEELTKFTYSTVLDGYNGSFMGCTNLERVDLTGKTHLSPRETSDKPSYGLFGGCSNLQTIGDISNINIIPYYAFYHCSKLKEKIITTATSLRGRCFESCSQIPSIIILTSTVPSLTVTYGTIAIAGTTCPIYVRPELYKSFMVATNWSSYRSRIKNFFTGPVLIIKDGVYTYSLRTEAFEEYQGLTFSIDENDYLSLNFDGETATITASGIVSGVDEPVGVHYSFIYRGKEVSGTFNISVTYKEIIDFEDAEVKRICVANWGGEYSSSTNKYGVQGELTYEQAAAVTNIGKVFNGNTKITSFMEFQYFTSLIENSLYQAAVQNIPFYNCRNLKKIKVPEGITYINGLFRNCASLVFIELPSTLTGADTIRYYTFGGNPSTPANKKLVVHFNHPFTLTASGAYGTYCGTFNRGIYVPDEHIDEFKAADVWKNNNIYPLSEWDGTY